MAESKRHVRPEPDRQAPIRSFRGVSGQVGTATAPAGAPHGGAPSNDSIAARGAELGYRVIDEYVRQGQAFARAVRPPADTAGASALDPGRLTERMFQNAFDLAAAWLAYAQAVTSQLARSQPFARPSGPSSAAGRAAPHVGGFDIDSRTPSLHVPISQTPPRAGASAVSLEVPSVTLDIVSKRRLEVTVELKPGSAQASLEAHDLRPAALDQARISGVVIEPDPATGRVVVRLEVPDDMAQGTYTGLVVDGATNLPQGAITVRIPDVALTGGQ